MFHFRQVSCCVTATNGTRKTQQAEVMLSNGAEGLISLHIETVLETLRHPVEINAKTSCQIDIALTSLQQTGLIAGCLFGGTLFHVQMRGIEQPIDSSPGRQLPASRLSAGNLLQGHHQVHFWVLRSLQCQSSYIVVFVLTNEIPCLFID